MSCQRMDAATCASNMSVGGALCTYVTYGQRSWTCSGATSSSCSLLRLPGPGFSLGYSGIWLPWCMVIFLVRELGSMINGWFHVSFSKDNMSASCLINKLIKKFQRKLGLHIDLYKQDNMDIPLIIDLTMLII